MLSFVLDEELKCLAFGHAWPRPGDWHTWSVDKAPKTPNVYTVKTSRACLNNCSAMQHTTLRLRTSIRGNIVEVVSTRTRTQWLNGNPMPRVAGHVTRDEYRLEMIRRQLVEAVRGTGTKMRRADAAANITTMLNRRG